MDFRYAPESLRDGKFSVSSDVWSYGVTMCEMFAHGEEPKLATVSLDKAEGQEQQILLSALESGARYVFTLVNMSKLFEMKLLKCEIADPNMIGIKSLTILNIMVASKIQNVECRFFYLLQTRCILEITHLCQISQ